jgi:hypothetical protein
MIRDALSELVEAREPLADGARLKIASMREPTSAGRI